MANIAVAVQYTDPSGITPTYQAPNVVDVYQVPNDERVVIHVKKTGAGACNMTCITPGSVDGQAIGDRVIVVPATTGDKMAGPFSRTAYSETLNITFSDIAGLTFAAVRLP